MLFVSSANGLVQSEEEIRAALTDWEQTISNLPSVPSDRTLAILGEAVNKLSRDKEIHQEWRRRLFLEAQKKALSLPGHAEYFAELIEKERAELKPGEYRGRYDDRRDMYLTGVLVHLPSPETVKVLGGFLEDERDFSPVRWLQGEAAENHFEGGAEGGSCANSAHAANAFSGLGLRDPPSEPRYPKFGERKRLWRQWWEEVKSGTKPFSFKGQSVEYRFNPDGSWTTTPIANPPDDAPKPVPPTEPPPPAQPSPPPLAPPPPPPAQPSGLPWPWLGAGALLFIAALVRLVVLRGRRAG